MTITRVLVAHDAGARWFENRGPGKGLVKLNEVEFEDGRRQSREIDTDRQGRGFGAGPGGHAHEPAQSPHEHAVENFARELAKELGQELRRGAFARLILIAPPRFLGVLRGELDSLVTRAVLATIPKDLPRANEQELCKHLEAHIAC
jgi:protein required for attachment to host cells